VGKGKGKGKGRSGRFGYTKEGDIEGVLSKIESRYNFLEKVIKNRMSVSFIHSFTPIVWITLNTHFED
jgi:hypothetical protein